MVISHGHQIDNKPLIVQSMWQHVANPKLQCKQGWIRTAMCFRDIEKGSTHMVMIRNDETSRGDDECRKNPHPLRVFEHDHLAVIKWCVALSIFTYYISIKAIGTCNN